MRDIGSATRLDRILWLNIGLDAGYVLVGLTLGIVGWRLGRRLGLVGAGIGVLVQGTALAVLDLVLAAHISR
jgi:sulfite exporter TauE/SafE